MGEIVISVILLLFAEGKIGHTSSNVFVYAITLVMFSAMCFFMGRWPGKSGCCLEKWIFWILDIVNVIALVRVFLNNERVFASDTSSFMWHQDKFVALLLVASCIGLSLVIVKKNEQLGCSVGIIQIICVSVYGYTLYCPNYMWEGGWILHHGNAYFNSVYNVMHLVPYNEVTNSIYGCYAIILAPLTNLFGGTVQSMVFVLAVLGMVSMLCYQYVLNNVVNSTLVRSIASIAMCLTVVSMRWCAYFQAHPHRDIFVALMLAYLIYTNKKRKTVAVNIGFVVIMALSLVWNFETGVVTVLMYFLVTAWKAYHQFNLFKKSFWKSVFRSCVMVVTSGIICVSVLEGYNRLAGAEYMSLREYMYPYCHGLDSMLQTNLPNFFSAYLLMLLVFLFFLGTSIMRNKGEDDIFFIIAVCGLGSMVYYINRTAFYNLDLAYPFAIILISNMADDGMTRLPSITLPKRIWSFQCLCVITFLCILTIINYPEMEKKRSESYRPMSNIDVVIDEMSQIIPPDTPAIGKGVTELYSLLGWDTQIYTMDFSDIEISKKATQHAYESALAEEKILLSADAITILQNKYSGFEQHFEIKNTFQCQGYVWYYCEK